MIVIPMDLIGDLFAKITQNIAGVPTLVWMAIPFIIGLIVGWLIKKVLKIAIIAAVVVFIIAYFGFFGLSLSGLGKLAEDYGPIALQWAVLLFGILPLSIGFIIGIILGFIFG